MELFAENVNCFVFEKQKWKKAFIPVPREAELTVNINGKKLVSILCTPYNLEYLVLGFLYSESIIKSADDFEKFNIDSEKYIADVYIKNRNYKIPENRILTSGFGKGTMFEAEGRGIDTDFRIKPEKIFSLVKQLNSSMELYKTSGGVHASALANHERILSIAEDIGRHNTFDKIQGECLKKNILTRDCIVITTGRISSEMLLKASRMGLPVVVSMKSPTGNAVAFAEKLNITLIGKAKGEKIVVYTNAHRLKEH